MDTRGSPWLTRITEVSTCARAHAGLGCGAVVTAGQSNFWTTSTLSPTTCASCVLRPRQNPLPTR
eukprot:scaffold59500_cov82-Phaeocystis_antarctica.AAC.1